jgi:hypothetical protein
MRRRRVWDELRNLNELGGDKKREWLKKNLDRLSEGFFKNLGTLLAAILVSGGWLIAINKVKDFQLWVREIPTDYVLTPLVLLLVILAVVLRINYAQRRQLTRLQTQPAKDDDYYRFVTYCGVWWKIFPEAEYIEDFPYCPCCQPKQKLVQTEWLPHEKFKCPKTGTEVMLCDSVPWEKQEVLKRLYESYFRGTYFDGLLWEYIRTKELNPAMSEEDLLREIFKLEPLNKIPKSELEKILARFQSFHEVKSFLTQNYRSYAKYLVRRDK